MKVEVGSTFCNDSRNAATNVFRALRSVICFLQLELQRSVTSAKDVIVAVLCAVHHLSSRTRQVGRNIAQCHNCQANKNTSLVK